MMNPYIQEIETEFKLALQERDHPLKFCVLATEGLNNAPQSRLIVLREMTSDFKFTFFTDERSGKVAQIKNNPKVCLLFYHPIKKIQLKVEGIAAIVEDKGILEKKWSSLSTVPQKNYTTNQAPGSKLVENKDIEYLKNKNYFCILEVQAQVVEYLKLREVNHFKVQFHKDINGWVSEFLVP